MANITVRYVGIADQRHISKADLEAAGIKNVPGDLVWNRANLFRVDVPGSEKLNELLEAQGHFTVETPKDDGSAEQLVVANHPDLEGDVLVDGDTGAETEVASTPATKTKR